ncbi:btb/poz domain-containing protein [Anaeramoeba flamelloides]|uniref:Btb/poz domain-containing protein n=1 Tax=Anaeramoeba flamelloides TaxID=1746091 RepID=A0ABQ8YRA0_9EUKA|nr:btb/poz domain-containing protein [Anaeramoeba flamelloides]
MYKKLENLYYDTKMTNLEFVLGKNKTKILGHKLIFSYQSEFFRNLLFKSDWQDQTNQISLITISDVNPEVFKAIKWHVYTGKFDTSPELAFETVLASRLFNLTELQKQAEETLVHNLTNESCLVHLKLAITHNLSDMKQKIINYISQNLNQILKIKNCFQDLPERLVETIIRQNTTYFEKNLLLSRVFEFGEFLCQQQAINMQIENVNLKVSNLIDLASSLDFNQFRETETTGANDQKIDNSRNRVETDQQYLDNRKKNFSNEKKIKKKKKKTFLLTIGRKNHHKQKNPLNHESNKTHKCNTISDHKNNTSKNDNDNDNDNDNENDTSNNNNIYLNNFPNNNINGNLVESFESILNYDHLHNLLNRKTNSLGAVDNNFNGFNTNNSNMDHNQTSHYNNNNNININNINNNIININNNSRNNLSNPLIETNNINFPNDSDKKETFQPISFRLLNNNLSSIDQSIRLRKKKRTDFGTIKILLMTTDSSLIYRSDVIQSLKTSGIKNLEILNVRRQNPKLSLLRKYDAIFLFSSVEPFLDSRGVGDTLSQYVEDGGGVIICSYRALIKNAWKYKNAELKGKIVTNSFLPLTKGELIKKKRAKLGDIQNPSHPLVKNVRRYNGGSLSYRIKTKLNPTEGNVDTTCLCVAEYDDGIPFIALKKKHELYGPVIVLNFWPVSGGIGEKKSRYAYWLSVTDGRTIIGNAIKYASLN